MGSLSEAIIRRFTRRNGPVDVRATEYESLAIAQIEPQKYEMTRAGRRFLMQPQSGVTGIAPVAALPTVAAQWAIWNNDSYDSYIFEEIGMLLVSGTAAAGIVLLAAPFTLPATVGASATGMSVKNASMASSLTTNALLKSGVTLTANKGGATFDWYPIAKSDSANTGVLSVAVENRNLQGSLIIPPQTGLALCVLSGAGTTPLFAPFGSWLEMTADLE